jgi:hypothetical protein
MNTFFNHFRNWFGLVWILAGLFYWYHDNTNMAVMMLLLFEMEDFFERKAENHNQN